MLDVEALTKNILQQREVLVLVEILLVSTSVDLALVELSHKRIKKFAEVLGYRAFRGLAIFLAPYYNRSRLPIGSKIAIKASKMLVDA